MLFSENFSSRDIADNFFKFENLIYELREAPLGKLITGTLLFIALNICWVGFRHQVSICSSVKTPAADSNI